MLAMLVERSGLPPALCLAPRPDLIRVAIWTYVCVFDLGLGLGSEVHAWDAWGTECCSTQVERTHVRACVEGLSASLQRELHHDAARARALHVFVCGA